MEETKNRSDVKVHQSDNIFDAQRRLINSIFAIRNDIEDQKIDKDDNSDKFVNTVITSDSITNVVTGEKLRKVQSGVLRCTKEYLKNTFGPMGSNTKIINGNDIANISSAYSKDGLKVLKDIKFSGPIEASIVEELIEITRHVEGEVGDGTTSSVILSSIIFDYLDIVQKKFKVPPHALMKVFNSVVEKIKDKIKEAGRECTLDDIYDIAMISTNSNAEVANNLKNIYDLFNMDVDISIGISNTSDSVVKAYDGLVVSEGMSDPAYINNRENNTCEIKNPKIYHFVDPVDTMDMITLFESIINTNIIKPLRDRTLPIPTVICTPKISKDAGAILNNLCTVLYNYDSNNMSTEKPPICVITNLVASDEIIMNDIADLCGCKPIKKYIDPDLYKKDLESGEAPSVDTIVDFCGHAELVVADSKKTKFINPDHMKTTNENGELVDDPIYTSMVQFLKTELKNSVGVEDASGVGLLKKRLKALEENIVDYLVGGITISERDQKKDLVEDAVKNCHSAVESGVGFAANFEGLRAARKVFNELKIEAEFPSEAKEPVSDLELSIARIIYCSYWDVSKILYGTVAEDDNLDVIVAQSLIDDMPFNIASGSIKEDDIDSKDRSVLCSIMLDINILDTISKIIGMMVTCNQCLLQAPQLNKY